MENEFVRNTGIYFQPSPHTDRSGLMMITGIYFKTILLINFIYLFEGEQLMKTALSFSRKFNKDIHQAAKKFQNDKEISFILRLTHENRK